jgi:hypothetical protein
MQDLRTELERQRAEAAESRSAAQKTEEKLAADIEGGERRRAHQKFVVLWLAILAAGTIAVLSGLIRQGASPQVLVISLGALAMGWLLFVDHAGGGIAAIKEWPPFEVFRRFRAWVYGTLLAGALASAAWDGAKYLWTASPQGSQPKAIQGTPQSK